jgi:hypothetical protein
MTISLLFQPGGCGKNCKNTDLAKKIRIHFQKRFLANCNNSLAGGQDSRPALETLFSNLKLNTRQTSNSFISFYLVSEEIVSEELVSEELVSEELVSEELVSDVIVSEES